MVLLPITHPNLPKTNKFGYDNSNIFTSLLEAVLFYLNYKRDIIDINKVDISKLMSMMKTKDSDTEIDVIQNLFLKIEHNLVILETDTIKFYSKDYQPTNKFLIVFKKGSNLYSVAQNSATGNLYFEYEDMNILFYPNGKYQKYNRLLNIKKIQDEAIKLEIDIKVRSNDNKRNKMKNKVLLLEEIFFKCSVIDNFDKFLGDEEEKNEI